MGIWDLRIVDTPITIIDQETTGLVPGVDRVVELAILRIDPGEQPDLILDTLINPLRPVSATEIHGITDEDVVDAPTFGEITPLVISALHGTVVTAYNIYFDIRFLAHEMRQAGLDQIPPHFCLMYMRRMLDLGSRCKLETACRQAAIVYDCPHVASFDVRVCGELMHYYLEQMQLRGIETDLEPSGLLAEVTAWVASVVLTTQLALLILALRRRFRH